MTPQVTRSALQAVASQKGIALSDEEAKRALAGANWLRDCVALLRKVKLGK